MEYVTIDLATIPISDVQELDFSHQDDDVIRKRVLAVSEGTHNNFGFSSEQIERMVTQVNLSSGDQATATRVPVTVGHTDDPSRKIGYIYNLTFDKEMKAAIADIELWQETGLQKDMLSLMKRDPRNTFFSVRVTGKVNPDRTIQDLNLIHLANVLQPADSNARLLPDPIVVSNSDDVEKIDTVSKEDADLGLIDELKAEIKAEIKDEIKQEVKQEIKGELLESDGEEGIDPAIEPGMEDSLDPDAPTNISIEDSDVTDEPLDISDDDLEPESEDGDIEDSLEEPLGDDSLEEDSLEETDEISDVEEGLDGDLTPEEELDDESEGGFGEDSEDGLEDGLDDGLDDDSLEEEDSGEELGDGEDEEDEWDTGDEDESAWDDEDYLNSDEESEEESMGEETGDVEGDELEPDNTPFDENAPDDELEGLDGLSDPGGADDLLGNDNPDDLDENSDESEIDERIERLKNERNPSVDEETKIDWELVKVLQSIKSRLARNKNKGDIQDDTATFRKDIKFNKDIYNNINIDLTMLDDYEANISLQDIVDLQRSNEEKDALLMESNLALKELLDFCQYLKEENEEEHLRGEMIAHITNIDNSVDVNLLRSFDLEQLVGFYKYMAEGRDESQDQQDLSEKTEGSVDLQQQQTQTVSRDIPPAPIHQGRHQISLSSSTIQIDNQAYDEALKIFGEVGPRKDNPQGGY